MGLKCYVCDNHCDFSDDDLQVCEDAITCWKTSIVDTDGTRRYYRGCTQNTLHMLMVCRKNTLTATASTNSTNKVPNTTANYNITCCRENFCNGGPFPHLPSQSTDITNWILGSAYGLTAAAVVGIMMVIIVSYGLYRGCRRIFRKKRSSELKNNEIIRSNSELPPVSHAISQNLSVCNKDGPELHTTQIPDIHAVCGGLSTLTSGSGAGKTLLIQRTLGKQVYLAECLTKVVNQGGFGRQIWRGVRLSEDVAVKVYNSRDEATWSHEVDIYSHLCINRHEFILGFIGTDIISRSGDTQLWLVTDYCPLGSLYNFLHEQPKLDYNQMFNICMSIIRGLIYLHQEIRGCSGAEISSFNVKPAVAHCNLRSKNILMKTNQTCFISDFSYAVTQDKLTDDKLDRLEEVSKLYMAPELLQESFHSTNLEDFCNADIYSLSLIIWEVCRKSSKKDVSIDYSMPYSHILGNNLEPSLEEMRKLIVTDQCRPEFTSDWSVDPTLKAMKSMIQECWYNKPASRLPPLRIKKILIKEASNHSDVHLQSS